VAWQLGVHLTVQVVPGASGRLLHVLAGEAGEVAQAGAALCRKAWSYAVPRRASLVVAAIEGDQSQQTWQNLGRAVAAALCSVADDGAIALCCELTERPGPAVKRLAQADNLQAALRQIRGSRFADALTAARLAEALDRVKLYLLSRLDEELVEDLGVAAVREGREIARLASRHASCILLGNAQYALALPDEN
jgi:nickel-dependent lactate racemase